METTKTVTRYGNFSSSNAWKLCTWDKPHKDFGAEGHKYIKQCNHERNLQRSINKEVNARELSFGKVAERVAFDLLPTDYKHVGDEIRYVHPKFPYWVGIPDLIKSGCNSEVKCCFNLEKFCDKLYSISCGWEQFKKDFKEDAWQLVSNNILLNANGIKCDTVEAINYVPYLEELPLVLNKLVELGWEELTEFRWLKYADFKELPYLVKEGKYKNLNVATFTIPNEDKDFLTHRLELAGKILNG